ncbi:DegT/DnrJ/EryC1/StrS family aminotransferase [Candidatus Bathyarchaeota archaeon]|nr:DegT/DnrJ/EryC1/StrS family aminotransferase [Candidatus Bathyarchaeota archaeon]
MTIPLVKVYMDDDIKKAVLEVLDSGWYILHEKVREFERKIANFCGIKNAVCVSSGTAAIFLSLLALDIKRGDEVIIPSFSFIATATPIIAVGAKPVFVEIDAKTYTANPEKIRQAVTKQTKAIMPVHLYGHPANMNPILEMAKENNLYVIEDACQAHGAEYEGKKVGGIGHVACFSFYPSKNMTVCGDGGVVVTNDTTIAEKVRKLRDHGRLDKYVFDLVGYNLRFNEIQAAIGIKQLEKLPQWNETRRKMAKMYNEALDGLVITPIEEPWAKHVYHVYVIRIEKRDELMEFLKRHGISSLVHYPVPIHKQPAIISVLGVQPKMKVTEKLANQVLSIPMHPKLTKDEVAYVSDKITEFTKSHK